jgi:2-dehydro-3-deoxyphosphogluconate aldolase/(4S)-4-hydroxy-2-oxoglutarate aldolase
VERLGQSKILFILRGLDPEDVLRVAESVESAGFTHLEITCDSPQMPGLLRRVRDTAPRLMLGAGTVLDLQTAEDAIESGAQFLVSPHTDEALVSAIVARGVPAIPGALSPTEILRAHRTGAAAVKLFPARAAGPDALRDLLGPFPALRIIPTGGIPLGEIPRWLEAGAFAVGAGRGLLLGGTPGAALGHRAGGGGDSRLDPGHLRATLARLSEIARSAR